MKSVKFSFVNNLPYGSAVFADGKEIKVNKLKNGRSEALVETEKEEVEIRITNPFDGQLPFLRWLIRTAICWLISVFGIFDRVENRSCRVADVKLNVKTAENVCLTMKFNLYRKDSPVVQITGDNVDFTEINNVYYVDEKAKKRVKFYKIWRIFFILAAAVITSIIIFSRR
ncbi:MAG: hypothetical protein IJU83_00640 [Clostridia bacterium]|nr:hypothetical protein [Clostridia bacterium]